MLKHLAAARPFLLFYIIAILFPTVLFSYMIGLETYFQAIKGSDFSYVGSFYALQADLISRYPIVFQHRDSVVLYLACYAVMPAAAPFLFFPLAPTVSALLVTWKNGGMAAIRSILRLYKPIQGTLSVRDGIQIYAAMVAAIIMLYAALFISASVQNDTSLLQGMRQSLGLFDIRYFLVGAMMALFLNQGGLLEELGWRGFALPMMMKRYSPLVATLIVGVCWALWHLPREIPTLLSGQEDLSSLIRGQIIFISACCGLSIVVTWFVNLTGGSVLPAIMWHGMFNYIFTATSSRVEGSVRSDFDPTATIIWLSVALVTLLIAGTDLGYKRRLAIRNEGAAA